MKNPRLKMKIPKPVEFLVWQTSFWQGLSNQGYHYCSFYVYELVLFDFVLVSVQFVVLLTLRCYYRCLSVDWVQRWIGHGISDELGLAWRQGPSLSCCQFECKGSIPLGSLHRLRCILKCSASFSICLHWRSHHHWGWNESSHILFLLLWNRLGSLSRQNIGSLELRVQWRNFSR